MNSPNFFHCPMKIHNLVLKKPKQLLTHQGNLHYQIKRFNRYHKSSVGVTVSSAFKWQYWRAQSLWFCAVPCDRNDNNPHSLRSHSNLSLWVLQQWMLFAINYKQEEKRVSPFRKTLKCTIVWHWSKNHNQRLINSFSYCPGLISLHKMLSR